MSKKVVGFTGFIFVLCLLLLGVQITRYYSGQKEGKEKQNQKIEAKIQDIEKQLKEREKEKQALEEEKAWKIEVYETWEKVVKP